MRIIKKLSLKLKIIFIILFVTFVVILGGYVLIIKSEIATYKNDIMNNVLSSTKIIGEVCISTLSFKDTTGARDQLNKLLTIPAIEHVWLFNENNQIFVKTGRSSKPDIPLPALTLSKTHSGKYLHIVHQIKYQNNFYGTLYVQASTKTYYQTIKKYMIKMSFIFLGMLILTFFLASKLQKIITKPLQNLTDATKTIYEEKNYSIRVKKSSNDEIGILCDSFNNMLNQIENRSIERNKAQKKLQENEEKLKKLVSNISDVIVILDRDGIIKYKSPNIFQNFGWNPDELIGKSGFLTVHPDDLEKIQNKFKEILEAKQNKTIVEYKYQCKNGDYRPVELTAINMLNDPLINGILASYKDVGIRKDAEKALLKNSRLGAIGEMAASVAHDFNNSLQLIFGNLELAMLSPDLSKTTLNLLSNMKRAADDASARVQILQRFSGKKHSSSKFEPLDLNSLIEEVITQSKPLWKDKIEKKGLSIIIHTKFGKIPNIWGNSGELRSVIYNIVKNSIEAMPEGGELIFETSTSDEQALLTIRDTGTGMDQETKNRVFQPFFSTKGFEMGRGLGMSGVYSIIQEHKGEIFVEETSPQKGTSIKVILPVSKIGKTEKNKKIRQNHNSLRILWVDDEDMLRELAKKYIYTLGCTGDTVSNGQDALELLNSKKYDIVITDLGMPGMSGWQLTEKIRTNFGDKIKIAIVTGWGDQVLEDKKNRPKIDFILGKPIEIENLQKIIKKVAQSFNNQKTS